MTVQREWQRVGARVWRVANPGVSRAEVVRKRCRDGVVVTINGERLRTPLGDDVWANEVEAIMAAEDALDVKNRMIGVSILAASMGFRFDDGR